MQYCNEPLSNSGESTDHIWCQRAGCRHRTQRKKHLLPAPGSSSFCSVLRELEQPPGQHNSHAFPSEKSGFIKTERTASPFNVWVSTVSIKRSCVLFHLIQKQNKFRQRHQISRFSACLFLVFEEFSLDLEKAGWFYVQRIVFLFPEKHCAWTEDKDELARKEWEGDSCYNFLEWYC